MNFLKSAMVILLKIIFFYESDSAISFSYHLHKFPRLRKDKDSKNNDLNYSPIVTYDKKDQKIKIITDPFGLDFIYIALLSEGRLCFSSHLKYIILNEPRFLNEFSFETLNYLK